MEPIKILYYSTIVFTFVMLVFLALQAQFANQNFWGYDNSYDQNCPLLNPNS